MLQEMEVRQRISRHSKGSGYRKDIEKNDSTVEKLHITIYYFCIVFNLP